MLTKRSGSRNLCSHVGSRYPNIFSTLLQILILAALGSGCAPLSSAFDCPSTADRQVPCRDSEKVAVEAVHVDQDAASEQSVEDSDDKDAGDKDSDHREHKAPASSRTHDNSRYEKADTDSPDKGDDDKNQLGGDKDQEDPEGQKSAVASQASVIESRFDFYHDSEQNSTYSLMSGISVPIRNFVLSVEEYMVWARDHDGTTHSDTPILSAYRSFSDSFAVGGGVGIVHTGKGWSGLIGSLNTHLNLNDVTLALNASHHMLTESAQTIRQHIRQTELGVELSDDFSENLSADLEFQYRILSDHNSSINIEFSPEYSFDIWKSTFGFGFRVQYQNFAIRTEDEYFDGYWAPNGLLSNEGTVTWKFKWGDYYGSTELALGRSFHVAHSSNSSSEGFSISGAGVVGRNLGRGWLLEGYAGGFRDALGNPSGWSSFNTGLVIKFAF